jgi:hypothetical protein
MGEIRNENYTEDLGVDSRIIILKWILNKYGLRMWTGSR